MGKPLHPKPRKVVRERSARLNMRQPADEQRRWKAEAAALGLTLTDYVRSTVNGTPIKVVRVTDPAIVREARRAGHNLSRLLRLQQAHMPVDLKLRDEVLEAFAAAYRRMLEDYD